MKIQLFFYFLLLNYSLIAGEFRGGDIHIQQHTALSVQANINVNVIIHSEIENIVVCWGDGSCDILGSPQVLEYPSIDTKILHFFWIHQYNQHGDYDITVEECCWSDDIFNMNLTEAQPFKLVARFKLNNPQVDAFNVMPYSPTLPIIEGTMNQFLVYNSLVNIPDSDESTFAIGEVDVQNYFLIEEIFNQPNNFFFDEVTGGFSWFAPPSPGYFIVKILITTTRGGLVISETSRDILIAIQNPVGLSKVENNLELNLKCSPNPAHDVTELTYHLSKTTSVQMDLFDTSGKLVNSQNLGDQNEGDQTISINIKDLARGTYFLKIRTKIKDGLVSFLKI